MDNPLGLVGILNRDTTHSRCFSRVVIAAHVQGITDINHLFYRNTEQVSKFSDAVGFVNARLGNVNRRRTPDSDRKLGNERIKNRFDLLPLASAAIPATVEKPRVLLRAPPDGPRYTLRRVWLSTEEEEGVLI
ncbi:MAG: hypothetical protein WBQ08_17190 [Candidatus Sulfotelmatobacter sp.]